MRNLDPRSLGICLQCGYDITGATAQTCPECGAAIEPFVRWTRRRLSRLAAIAVAPGLSDSLALAAVPATAIGFAAPSGTPALPLFFWLTALAMLGPRFLILAHLWFIAVYETRLSLPPALRRWRSRRVRRILRARVRESALERFCSAGLLVAVVLLAAAADGLANYYWLRIAVG